LRGERKWSRGGVTLTCIQPGERGYASPLFDSVVVVVVVVVFTYYSEREQERDNQKLVDHIYHNQTVKSS
jgi:hypothetical protein